MNSETAVTIMSIALSIIMYYVGYEHGTNSTKRKIRRILLHRGYGEYKINKETGESTFVDPRNGNEMF